MIPKPVVLFAAGAVAGAIGKTVTAPLDRVKLLLQTQGTLVEGAMGQAIRSGNLWQAFATIGREEGLRGYWKGNTPQILRVIPYSATQLYSYEVLKRMLRGPDGQLSLPARFTAGGCAGIIASLVTYPLDTLRLRLAVDPAARSLKGASRVLFREGSYQAYFRGLGPSLIGIFPYMAMELAVFDLLSDRMPEGGAFGRGFLSAFVATSCCYPLDTVRRQIQLQSRGRMSMMQAARLILQRDGVPGMYRGFVPNALKNLPNKGIRLATFDTAKRMIAASEAAAHELEANQ
ncbi:hypothetical protein WJX84_003372 [Apatococcus fuscideae]